MINYNLSVALQDIWRYVQSDVPEYYTARDAAELVMDRARGDTALELTQLINQHGYTPVLHAVAHIL